MPGALFALSEAQRDIMPASFQARRQFEIGLVESFPIWVTLIGIAPKPPTSGLTSSIEAAAAGNAIPTYSSRSERKLIPKFLSCIT